MPGAAHSTTLGVALPSMQRQAEQALRNRRARGAPGTASGSGDKRWWNSAAVSQLEKKSSEPRSNVVPMMMKREGGGEPMALCVGSERAHAVAGRALTQVRNGHGLNLDIARTVMPRAGFRSVQEGQIPNPPGSARSTTGVRSGSKMAVPQAGGPGGQVMRRWHSAKYQASLDTSDASSSNRPLAFGAVYEHTDGARRTMATGVTTVMPESQWEIDKQIHRGVAKCLDPNAAHGKTRLLWAGVGWPERGCGQQQVLSMANAVAQDHALDNRWKQRTALKNAGDTVRGRVLELNELRHAEPAAVPREIQNAATPRDRVERTYANAASVQQICQRWNHLYL
jgi:hypothetical protein